MSLTSQRKKPAISRTLALVVGLATVGALVVAIPASAGETPAKRSAERGKSRAVKVQLLSFNDQHGNLEPQTVS